jgi:hypothetical protein
LDDELGDITTGQTMTMAPPIVKGKVLAGNSVANWACAAGAPPCAYSTGRDKGVLIGAPVQAVLRRRSWRTRLRATSA